MLKITILGCGASGGVPLIGCKCEVCTSTNPKNKRSRVSILIQSKNTTILVDTSPDLREQALKNNIIKIDAIIYTHDHADHINGIDDLRAFNYAQNAPIDAYTDAQTLARLKERFSYVFLPPAPLALGWYRPCVNPIEIKMDTPFTIGDIEVLPFEQMHGKGKTTGLRIGKFAYSTDTNGLSEHALETLTGIDTWVVDCLRKEVAPSHAHLEMTIGWINKIKPRQSYLTHMHHGFEYESFATELPTNVAPAYDGLQFTV